MQKIQDKYRITKAHTDAAYDGVDACDHGKQNGKSAARPYCQKNEQCGAAKPDRIAQKQAKRDEAIGAITGATTEAQLAAQESRNKSYADALAEIASNASQLKDTYLQNYMAQKMGMTNPESGILANQANQWSSAASNLFGTGSSMLGSGLDGLGIGKGGGAKSSSPTSPTYDPRINTYKTKFYNSPTQ